MNQKYISESMRYTPLALAIVLFFVLGFLAFQAQAEANTTDFDAIREQMKADALERQAQYKRDAQERKEQFEQNKTELQELKGESARDEFEQIRTENRNQSQEVFEEYKAERIEMRSQQREEIRLLLEARKLEIQAKIEERKQERERKMEERQARLSVQKQAQLSQFSERIIERMNKAVERLRNISDRVASRIEKMETEGADVTAVRAELDDVYTFLTDAKELISLIGVTSVDTFTSEDPANQKQEIRDAVLLAKDGIKEVHIALSETVQLIKASSSSDSGDDENNSLTTEDPIVFEHSFVDGTHTYTATVVTPNPCYVVSASPVVAESSPEQITIEISTTVDENEICASVLDEKEFSVEVEASAEATLVNVKVNGKTVDWEINE